MAFGESTTQAIEDTAREIVDAAYQVHVTLGPGLLESVYEACLAHELAARGLKVLRQVRVPIRYRGAELDEGFRVDLWVNDCVIVEVKAVAEHHSLHSQQVKTYLKLTGMELGLLINFNVPIIKDGIKRVILNR
jgi:GxxExxY protein